MIADIVLDLLSIPPHVQRAVVALDLSRACINHFNCNSVHGCHGNNTCCLAKLTAVVPNFYRCYLELGLRAVVLAAEESADNRKIKLH